MEWFGKVTESSFPLYKGGLGSEEKKTQNRDVTEPTSNTNAYLKVSL